MIDIYFEKVICTEEQTKILYHLLEQRELSISHNYLTSYDNHKQFVEENPYLAWFIIYDGDNPIGSTYVQGDNSIGINLVRPNSKIVQVVIEFIKSNFSKKDSIPSRIPPYFFVNVPIADKCLARALEDLGAEAIQLSYKLD